MTKQKLEEIKCLVNEAISDLEFLEDYKDPEIAHTKADEILCTLLRNLGYGNVVDVYKRVPKWYC